MTNFNYLANAWAKLHPDWQKFLLQKHATELQQIDQQLTMLANQVSIYPPRELTFRALDFCQAAQTKVVILGQDPYHGDNEANGLAFAVNPGITPPPSLRNIFKELALEYPNTNLVYDSELLASWAVQGVLLLNSTLSVIKDQANSLAKLGWQQITNSIIEHICRVNPHCVFILWGNYARSKKTLINPIKHLILEAVHPSPLAAYRGFFGCNHFKLANQFLAHHNICEINWHLPRSK